mgnify:CR=1 FL=1
MAEAVEIQHGTVLEGPFFKERVRVLSSSIIGEERLRIEAVGLKTNTFYNPILAIDDLEKLKVVVEGALSFSGDGEAFFLLMESHRIRNAFQFDPLYAVNVSQVDPLPHQIDAIYHYILRNPSIRFLLADDPGAGKTIMAGLLLKELKYRGLVDRTLIIVPGHLKDQWIREMKEKFQETFNAVDRGVMSAAWGQNVWAENNQIITSIDFAKQDDVMTALKESRWDIVIVDEAHKMSAYRYGEKIDKTKRYRFGELISSITSYLLFLTATPHRGDPDNFLLFLDLLEPNFFASTAMLEDSIRDKDNPLFLRRLKEDMKDFEQKPLFPPRYVETVKYHLADSDDEIRLYNAVTEYVENHYNKALAKDKRNVAFAMVILQRRLASSVRAVRRSLERRRNRLRDLYEKGELIQEGLYYTEENLEDLEERERWSKEEELLEKLTSAATLEELKDEIGKLDELIALAKQAEKGESEVKLVQLRKLMEAEGLSRSQEKLLIFTEARDTQEYLKEKLQAWGYSVSEIHGGMNLDKRIAAEAEFKDKTQLMVATEAAGEGINLQFCHLCINYDIPWNPNRLEQRMGRIHRYGQQHEVHIYNLVAVDTIEGKILKKLFEKLDSMRKHMGSDRVFDVIGDVIPGKNLKDLILEAIARTRTIDEILADFDSVPDLDAIDRVREATLESLATRHIDLSRILGEQRLALENRLVPEYVEAFFRRAAAALDIPLEKRKDDFWRMPAVPFEVRNRPLSFKLRHGEVRTEYSRVSFDKERAFKEEAEFVAMGHPLMEAVIDTIFNKFEDEAQAGAVLFDPDGKLDGLLWFLQAEIKDGTGKVAGRRLFALYESMNGERTLVSPAILWDLKPGLPEGKTTAIQNLSPASINRDVVVNHVIGHALEPYRAELQNQRNKDAFIKEKYGLRSLDELLLKSDSKLADYYTRQGSGGDVPEAVISQEKRRKEDLQRKKERLVGVIEAETHLLPHDPEVLGVARVLPLPVEAKGQKPDPEVEEIGMEISMRYEVEQGRVPEDVSAMNLGYDIRSSGGDRAIRYIEVKARSAEGAVALTPNEWLMAHRLGEEYWLYIVANTARNPELYIINNPAAKLQPSEEISIVRYMVSASDWSSNAQREILRTQ